MIYICILGEMILLPTLFFRPQWMALGKFGAALTVVGMVGDMLTPTFHFIVTKRHESSVMMPVRPINSIRSEAIVPRPR